MTFLTPMPWIKFWFGSIPLNVCGHLFSEQSTPISGSLCLPLPPVSWALSLILGAPPVLSILRDSPQVHLFHKISAPSSPHWVPSAWLCGSCHFNIHPATHHLHPQVSCIHVLISSEKVAADRVSDSVEIQKCGSNFQKLLCNDPPYYFHG